ncbi:unnamed protein product [Closterium sp. Yama58-4]|nr:unnamed protein product [Closterium sp. Yama58-4]
MIIGTSSHPVCHHHPHSVALLIAVVRTRSHAARPQHPHNVARGSSHAVRRMPFVAHRRMRHAPSIRTTSRAGSSHPPHTVAPETSHAVRLQHPHKVSRGTSYAVRRKSSQSPASARRTERRTRLAAVFRTHSHSPSFAVAPSHRERRTRFDAVFRTTSHAECRMQFVAEFRTPVVRFVPRNCTTSHAVRRMSLVARRRVRHVASIRSTPHAESRTL